MTNRIDYHCAKNPTLGDIIPELFSFDPSKGKSLGWMIERVKDKSFIYPEDNEKISALLTTFHVIKQKKSLVKHFGIDPDINRHTIRSLSELHHIYSSTNLDLISVPADCEIVYKDDDYTVYKPNTVECVMEFGDSTDWCTRHKTNAERYFKNKSLCIWYKNGIKFAQSHCSDGWGSQFMDIKDNPVLYDTQMIKIFYLLHNKLLKIKKRMPEIEYLILKDVDASFFYAEDIIKGRWPEAEPYIMKDPQYACWYARFVVEDRWPEAEYCIKMDPIVAKNYAIKILERRWPEAEKYITQDAIAWSEYETYFNSLKGSNIVPYVNIQDHYVS